MMESRVNVIGQFFVLVVFILVRIQTGSSLRWKLETNLTVDIAAAVALTNLNVCDDGWSVN
jgi:hypothetical protein